MLDGARFYKVSLIYCQFELLVLAHLTKRSLKRLGTWAEAASAVKENGTPEAGNLQPNSLLHLMTMKSDDTYPSFSFLSIVSSSHV